VFCYSLTSLVLPRSRHQAPAPAKRAFRKRTSQLRAPLGFFGIVNAGLVVVNDPAHTRSDPATFR
jgi:hypothetical protein